MAAYGMRNACLNMFVSMFMQESRGSMIVFGIAVVLPFALEILQCLQLIPGTFDWLDVATYIIVLITFVLCERRHFSDCDNCCIRCHSNG